MSLIKLSQLNKGSGRLLCYADTSAAVRVLSVSHTTDRIKVLILDLANTDRTEELFEVTHLN